VLPFQKLEGFSFFARGIADDEARRLSLALFQIAQVSRIDGARYAP
jgi:hypothetical protein